MLRLVRESIPMTQAALAEALGVDVDTLQGWESGRRPLANMRAGALLGLRRRLPALGADATLVQGLDAAMDADRIIAAGLADDADGPHPLAVWVHTRDTAHMLAWALNSTVPPSLAGRLPRPRRGRSRSHRNWRPPNGRSSSTTCGPLPSTRPRRGSQGCCCTVRRCIWRRTTTAWMRPRGPRTRCTAGETSWPGGAGPRTGRRPAPPATALARLGDPQPLLDFIDRALADDDTAEAANLNYWALWLGALPVPQPDDGFMRNRDLTGWDPVTLLRGLARGLHLAPGYVDLYAHSLWALLTAFPWLPQAAGPLAGPLRERTAQLLDGAAISARSRRELAHVHYVFDHNR
ncbi:helix-turn-helix domain-containing protein [Streptomyces sp. TE33382]